MKLLISMEGFKFYWAANSGFQPDRHQDPAINLTFENNLSS